MQSTQFGLIRKTRWQSDHQVPLDVGGPAAEGIAHGRKVRVGGHMLSKRHGPHCSW